MPEITESVSEVHELTIAIRELVQLLKGYGPGSPLIAAALKRTSPRSLILELLASEPERAMKPREIADRLGRSRGGVRNLLFQMFRAGQVKRAFWGGGYRT